MPSTYTAREKYKVGDDVYCAKTGKPFRIRFIRSADNMRDIIGNTSGTHGNFYLFYKESWSYYSTESYLKRSEVWCRSNVA